MSFSSFGCLSHIKQKPRKYWMSGNQIVYWKRNIKVTTPTKLGKVLTKIYLIPSSWTKEMWSLFFFFYFQVEVLNKSSIHSNQHHNQKIRNRTRHLITTPNAKRQTPNTASNPRMLNQTNLNRFDQSLIANTIPCVSRRRIRETPRHSSIRKTGSDKKEYNQTLA